jgi:hypothetical protein
MVSIQVDPFTGLMVVVGLASLALIGQAAYAWWRGARLRTNHIDISSIRAGRVILSGIAEPAWAVVTSPFGKRACVWYDASSTVGQYRSARTIFSQVDAVSFVLKDATGRVLVLGRRARWDPSAGQPGSVPYARLGDLANELGRPLEDAQDYLYAYSDPDSSDPTRGDQTEKLVAVGERVTVSGRAFPDPARVVWGSDGCPDAGQSIGLPGACVVGPDRLAGLTIVAGYAEDLAARGRLRLLVGLLGLAGLVVVAIGFVVEILAGGR